MLIIKRISVNRGNIGEIVYLYYELSKIDVHSWFKVIQLILSVWR